MIYPVDLHLHTLFSDGTDDTRMLLSALEDNGITTASITDHDNVEAYYSIEPCKRIRIINGVELTCNYFGKMRHMLGYAFDLDKMNSIYKKWVHMIS